MPKFTEFGQVPTKTFFYETHKFTYKIKQLDVNYVFGFISINLRHFFFLPMHVDFRKLSTCLYM